MKYLTFLLFLFLVVHSKGQDVFVLDGEFQRESSIHKLHDSQMITNDFELLDSIIYYTVNLESEIIDTILSKREFSYSETGNLEYYIDFEWDIVLLSWQPLIKQEEVFDDQGRTLIRAKYKWDNERDAWRGNSYKDIYNYNSYGRMLLNITYQWDLELMDWVGLSQRESTYDQENKIMSYLHSTWEEDSSSWIYFEKKDFYRGDGQNIADSIFRWDKEQNVWQNFRLVKYQYHEDGVLEGYTTYKIPFGDEWIEESKDVYTYSDDTLSYEVVTSNNEAIYVGWVNWVPSTKNERVDDAMGNNVYSHNSYWDRGPMLWYSGFIYDRTYDLSGRESSYASRSYRLGANYSFTGTKDEYMYSILEEKLDSASYEWDGQDSVWSQTHKYEYTFYENEQVETKTQFVLVEDQWEINETAHYYYSSFPDTLNVLPDTSNVLPDTVDVGEDILSLGLNNPSVAIFPNPTQSLLNVKVSNTDSTVEIRIFDQAGRLVLREWILAEKQIDLNYLNSGIYIYRIQGEGLNATGKLIKN